MRSRHEALPQHLAGDVGCRVQRRILSVRFRVPPWQMRVLGLWDSSDWWTYNGGRATVGTLVSSGGTPSLSYR